MTVDKERLGGRVYDLFQVQGGMERDWEMALASLAVVLHTVCCTRLSSPNGKTEGCSSPPGFARDTPTASSTVQTRVGSKRMSGLQTTAATGLWAASSSSVPRPVTAHERVHRDMVEG